MGTDWGLVYKPVARSKPDGTPSQCCNSRSPTTGSQITVFRNEIAINEIAINETPARVTCRPGLIVSRPSSDQTSARSRRKPAENAWRVPTGRPFNYPILGLLPNSLAKLNRGSTKVIFQYDDLHSANDPELRGKQFGFISGDDNQEHFIHSFEFKKIGMKLPEPGDRIAFTAERGAKGSRAVWPSYVTTPRNVEQDKAA